MYNESHGEKCDAPDGRAAPSRSLRYKDKELEQKQNDKLQDDEQLGKYNTLFHVRYPAFTEINKSPAMDASLFCLLNQISIFLNH